MRPAANPSGPGSGQRCTARPVSPTDLRRLPVTCWSSVRQTAQPHVRTGNTGRLAQRHPRTPCAGSRAKSVQLGPLAGPGSPTACRNRQQTLSVQPAACSSRSARPDDFVLWFRRDRVEELRWLGDPQAHTTGLLNPRKSFDTWVQRVSGSSVPWTAADLQAAQLVAYDVESAQLSRAQARLAYLGLHDPLTGLPNRRHLDTSWPSCWQEQRQLIRWPLSSSISTA